LTRENRQCRAVVSFAINPVGWVNVLQVPPDAGTACPQGLQLRLSNRRCSKTFQDIFACIAERSQLLSSCCCTFRTQLLTASAEQNVNFRIRLLGQSCSSLGCAVNGLIINLTPQSMPQIEGVAASSLVRDFVKRLDQTAKRLAKSDSQGFSTTRKI